MELTPIQARVLRELDERSDTIPVPTLSDAVGESVEVVTGAVLSLEEAALVAVERQDSESVALTEEGMKYAVDGLPERRLHAAVVTLAGAGTPVPLGDAIEQADLGGPQVDIALSNLARKGLGEIDDGTVRVDTVEVTDAEGEALGVLADGTTEPIADDVLAALERRNLVNRDQELTRSVTLTDAGRERVADGLEATDAIGRITPEALTTRQWSDASFRSYNVAADAPTIDGGSSHVLRRMAERVKDVLVGMGFEEMSGPHVDADFWINDCLFMPQDHPARTHWDRFELAEPQRIDHLPEELVERVRRAHREGVGPDGDGYHSPWEEAVAEELALRGHTTSLSARHLAGVARGDLEAPQRFFSVEKAYRNDSIDATHLLEFFQIEGWVMAESLSVRDLMGTFTEFYAQFGIHDLEFKPHYNPYTEPSFELFGTHPRTGELIEIGNSGIFRPEMLDPLGVEADVMAWGLALERLLMLITGAEDIRDVHGTLVDLDFLRTEQVVY